jgi:uncharacterized protein (DUF58 family)
MSRPIKKIPVPTGKLFRVLILLLPLFAAGLFFFPLLIAAVVLDLFILFLAVLDYGQAARADFLSFSITGGRFFSLGKKNSLGLEIRNRSSGPLDLEIKVDLPESWEVLREPGFIRLAAGESREQELAYRPLRRGVYRLEYLHYRYRTPSGLLLIQGKQEVGLKIEVFPDVKEINRYLMMSRRHRLYQMGVHRDRFRGRGTNLEYLREYQEDDDSRRIDWKASTRNNKLVCKEFQMETNNLVAMVLDCGRLMTAEQKGLNSLDYAINAALILAYTANKIGDSVSIFAFADKLLGELPPLKGKQMMNRVLRFLTPLQPSFVESNYQQIFEHLQVRLKRRALVILFSDLIDDINYQLFYRYLSLLGRRHIPLVILLRDTLLMESADLEPHRVEDVYTAAAAADMVIRRAEAIKKFRQKKINLLDLLPQEVTPSLLDKYLELKSRNLI